MSYMRDASGRRLDSIVAPSKLRATLRPLPSLPAPMATPPTIGSAVSVSPGTALVTATNGSSLTNPVVHPFYVNGFYAQGINTARFRYQGWTLVDSAPGDSLARHYGISVSPGGYSGGGYPGSVEFIYYGTAFEIKIGAQAGTANFNLFVDGVPTAATNTAVSTSAGASQLIPVTFASAGLRRIKIEFNRSLAFGGIIISPTDLLAATSKEVGPQIYHVADSYGDGANGVTGMDTYAVRLAHLLQADSWIDAQGGTGFANNQGGAGKTRYQPRVSAAGTDARLKPDIVILQGSTNDSGIATVGTEAQACIATIRTQWPTAKIVMTGVLHPFGLAYIGGNAGNNNAQLLAVATGTNPPDLFIDAVAEGWFTGNGKANAPTGNGNADIFMSSDSVHGTPAFHDLVAGMLARRIADWVVTT